MTDKPITLMQCLAVLLAIGFAALMTVLVYGLMSSPVDPVDPYCEMVSIWIDSDGEYGWPDYRETYSEECLR